MPLLSAYSIIPLSICKNKIKPCSLFDFLSYLSLEADIARLGSAIAGPEGMKKLQDELEKKTTLTKHLLALLP